MVRRKSGLRPPGSDSRSGSSTSEPKTKGRAEGERRLLTSRKFLLCVTSMLGYFVLVLMDKDVRALEIIAPMTLAVYFGANVGSNFVYRQGRNHDSEPSRDLSDLRGRRRGHRDS